jgi:hypothetical protein
VHAEEAHGGPLRRERWQQRVLKAGCSMRGTPWQSATQHPARTHGRWHVTFVTLPFLVFFTKAFCFSIPMQMISQRRQSARKNLIKRQCGIQLKRCVVLVSTLLDLSGVSAGADSQQPHGDLMCNDQKGI